MSEIDVRTTKNIKTDRTMKIHDSKGKIYVICPFLRKIEKLLFESIEENRSINNSELFEIRRHIEAISAIAEYYQKENDCAEMHYEKIHSPYNFNAVIKNLKICAKSNNLTIEKIDEIINIYS